MSTAQSPPPMPPVLPSQVACASMRILSCLPLATMKPFAPASNSTSMMVQSQPPPVNGLGEQASSNCRLSDEICVSPDLSEKVTSAVEPSAPRNWMYTESLAVFEAPLPLMYRSLIISALRNSKPLMALPSSCPLLGSMVVMEPWPPVSEVGASR